ncbi:amidase family protein [Granulosicoccus sp. 3-233]|uniref:amidase family protein n=1 Tax=Granulosicoccus sp. 3-233 TaxID=3417969 RepID=UPI003D356978
MKVTFPWTSASPQERVDRALSRVRSDEPVLRHVFTQMFEKRATERSRSLVVPGSHPISGALVSVKDLFDVAGFVTRAGTRFMEDDAPAEQDASAIRRMVEAGAVPIGHTNMTELAYSGLGMNAHYGTPESVLYPGCIAGGSTAGGAVSVAAGVADIAIGTDTGGSLRIPAAFNGIVGFKPSQSAIPRQGCKPLSQSLDSIGPMAASVEACRLAFQTMRDHPETIEHHLEPRFIVPDNYGMDDLEPEVAAAFEHAIALLTEAGYSVEKRHLQSLEALKTLPVWHFSAVESRANHASAYENSHAAIDPRVSSRMARADGLSAIEYRHTLNLRQQLIRDHQQEMQGRVLLMPTVPMLPPRVSALADDETYNRVNLQALRNPSIANVMDGCSISLPLTHGKDTIGVMLTAGALSDQALLDLAVRCEALFLP